MRLLLRRLRARLRYRRFEADLRDEIETHRALKEADLTRAGASAAEARSRAARALGNVTLAREAARGVWLAPWHESVWQDVRYGVKALRRSPGFAATALVVLTLGTGLTTSLFGLADALLFRAWSLPDVDRVVAVYGGGASGPTVANTSPAKYRFLRDRAGTIELVARRSGYVRIGLEPDAEQVESTSVSGNYFSSLRVPLALGRGFQDDEDVAGEPVFVAVISHGLWTRRFGRSPAAVGGVIRINGLEFTIVGVTAPNVYLGEGPRDLWVPLAVTPLLNPESPFEQEFLTNPGYCCVRLAGRLRGGATREEAAVELSALADQFHRFSAPTSAVRVGMIVASTRMAGQPGAGQVLRVFALIAAALLLLLVVASANVGNLQLARGMRRRRELTIRHSLGASRARIVRQLLAESSVLAAAAALLALAGAFVLPRLAAGVVGARPVDLSPGGRVVAVAAGLALLAVLLSSLAPALRATRRLVTTPRQGSEARLRLRSTLLALQVAVSAILLIGAALFTRSLIRAATFDPGFAVGGVTIVSIFASSDTPTGARAERVEAMTEAVHASFREAGLPPPGAASLLPLSSSRMTTGVRRAGEDEGANQSALTLDVSPGYFGVLRVPITAGRVFTDEDGPEAVVINESLARRLWPGESALGRSLLGAGGGFERRVVGVAADAYLTSLDRVEPTLFRRLSGGSPSIGARTLLLPDNRALVDRARAAALAVDPGGRVGARPLGAQMQRALALPLMAAAIAGVIGLIAVTLASVGVFGVFSYVVEERTGEIGIRMALGARGAQVIGLIFRQTSWPLAGGLALGFVASLVAAPVLRAYLIGVGPHDPLAFLGVVVVLAVAAAVATVLPARRAAYVDPAITLRHD